jgi:hypothetical protein
MSKAQVKPMNAYAELDSSDKRLVHKLITTIHAKELDSNAWYVINRAINKSRRVDSANAKTKYTNGWLVFYKQRFPQVRKKNTNMEVTGIAKILGQEWRALSPAEKDEFKQKAAQQR